MRLRIRIERNALPPVQAVWPVKEGKSTIAQLLQHVNGVFPLESDSWGLEDYDVSVDGYECLHWHEVHTVCKEDEELVIKPLQYVDVRARTLTGRAQISADGRHLVDGVPFGKPCLKSPVRPEVRIPPRKRQRLLGAVEDDEPLMLTENGEELDQGSEEEDDGDFDEEESGTSSISDSSMSGVESEDSDESDEETSNLESESEDSTNSDSDSDPDSDSDRESWRGIANSAPTTPSTKTTINLANSIMPAPLAGTKRKRLLDDEHETENHKEATSANATRPLPFQGKVNTKVRNARRRDSNKLKHLKKMHVLPQDADLKTLREWQEQNEGTARPSGDGLGVAGIEDVTTTNDKAQDSIMNETEASMETVATELNRTDTRPFIEDEMPRIELHIQQKPQKSSHKKARIEHGEGVEDERQKLLNAIASGGIDVTEKRSSKKRSREPSQKPEQEDDEAPTGASSNQQKLTEAEVKAVESNAAREDRSRDSEPAAKSRRSQLDVAASRRLVFGDLGLKDPKTQEEIERVQKKLAARPKRNVSALNRDNSALPLAQGNEVEAATNVFEAVEDENSWMDKINLTAVECCEMGVTLSTPPFPFYQRWDPQQLSKKKGRNSNAYMSGGGKKRRHMQDQVYVETYDKYNTDGHGGDALDYGDPVEGAQEEYWEEGALLDGDYDSDGKAEEEDDGFPSPPTNLDELPQLTEDQAKVSDFVAFTELACNEGTSWEPRTVTRTAKIVEAPVATEGGGQRWVLQFPMKPKVLDGEGNRVYGKFGGPDQEADDDGKGIREISWAELGSAKLLLRPDEKVDHEA